MFFFGFIDEISGCDTKWIRFVYMMSCGKKKRESVYSYNETFYRNMPSDFDGAVRYYRERDPNNPLLNDEDFLHQIIEEDGELLISDLILCKDRYDIIR